MSEREIFLIDRSTRLESLLSEGETAEFSSEWPVGIGFFRCVRPESLPSASLSARDSHAPARGVHFEAFPQPIEALLLTKIAAGQHSPLSQDIVLLGTDGFHGSRKGHLTHGASTGLAPSEATDPALLLRRWLIAGLQPLADLAENHVPLSQVNTFLLKCQSLEAAVDALLAEIMGRAAEISAPCVVFPLGAPLFVDFLYGTLGDEPFRRRLGWDQEGAAAGFAPLSAERVRQKVVDATLAWFSTNPLEFRVILVCESDIEMQSAVSSCRMIQSSGASPRVQFRI